MKVCAYDKCGEEFEAATHNQKYCCDDHCRMATNDRLMQQYYERKARRQGKVRICKTPGCNTRLSRYNEEDVCQQCKAEQDSAEREALIRMLK